MNILKPFNDRINSPLYSTFLVAWCFTNWKVFYVTFFVTQRELGIPKFNYVQEYLHISNFLFTIIIPSIITYLYIYQLPKLEELVSAKFYYTRAARKRAKIDAMEKSPVTGDDYRKLLMKYVSREEDLNVFMDKERVWLKEKEELQSDLTKLNAQNSTVTNQVLTLSASLNTYRNNKNIHEFFKGRWLFKYNQQTKNTRGEEYFSIDPSSRYIVEGVRDNNPFDIKYFHHDSLNADQVYFLKVRETPEDPEIRFVQLFKIDDFAYEGKEYGIKSDKLKEYVGFDGSTQHKVEFVTFDVTYRKPILNQGNA